MKWNKVAQKAVTGAITGAVTGYTASGGDIHSGGIGSVVLSILSALMNWFKHR